MRPVNLIPDAHRARAKAADATTSYAVLGALATLLVMTLTYVFIANQATSRQSDAAAIRAEADALETRAAQMGAFGDFTAIKETRLASVRQLAAGRFDWERLMRELARAVPVGGWLQEVQAGSGDATAATDAAGTGGTAAGTVATLVGCLPRQSDVAALMLRLERMHRVEDVTLQESRRAKGAASLDDCGRLYQFTVQVTFGQPVEAEAPDGMPRVPASLGGGS